MEADKLLLSIFEQNAIIREHIAGIQSDVKEHIRRTNIIESELKSVQRQVYIAHGAIAFIMFIAALAKAFWR